VACTAAVVGSLANETPTPRLYPVTTPPMPSRTARLPLWFAVALVPMVASQLIRLQQTDPVTWVALDYAGRLGALAVLAAVPAVRHVVFRFDPLRIARVEVAVGASPSH
jgi:hypothetical protein